jgi:hypothetical protein
VRNPLGVVPLVPLRNRPRLRGVGRSEIEPVTSNQDAINYFRAMTVVGARFLAYPQRVLFERRARGRPHDGAPEEALQGGHAADLDDRAARPRRSRPLRAQGRVLRRGRPHVGRYRHPAPTCDAFLEARPLVDRRRSRDRDRHDQRIKGHSYPREWYEDAVGELLGQIGSLDDHTMTEVVRLYGED